jgi:hypothetical protein
VCTQIRDQYLNYPGISRAALAMVPTDLEIVRVSEGMLAILLAGGVAPQAAAWAIDALLLYVAAYCLEASIARRRSAQDDAGWVLDRDELLRRFTPCPPRPSRTPPATPPSSPPARATTGSTSPSP